MQVEFEHDMFDSFIQYTEQTRYLVASPALPLGPLLW